AQVVPDIHRVADAEGGVLTDFRSLGCGTGSPDGVMEGLRRNHGTAHAGFAQRIFNTVYDFGLLWFAECIGRNDVGIVSGPIADADLAIMPDDVFKADRLACGRMEKSIPFVCSRPLRSRNVILAPGLGAVSSSACFDQAAH